MLFDDFDDEDDKNYDNSFEAHLLVDIKTIDIDQYDKSEKELDLNTPLYVMIGNTRFLMMYDSNYVEIDVISFIADEPLTTSDEFNKILSVMGRRNYRLSDICYGRKELTFSRPKESPKIRRNLDIFEEDE